MGKKRLIDANDVIKKSEELHLSETFIEIVREVLERCDTVKEYSDEPLSLEELKKINGDYPVYICAVNNGIVYQYDYATVELSKHYEGMFFATFIGKEILSKYYEGNYGKTWLAYLRKPDKEE